MRTKKVFDVTVKDITVYRVTAEDADRAALLVSKGGGTLIRENEPEVLEVQER